MKRFLTILGVLLLALVFVACDGDKPKPPEPPVEDDLVITFTGVENAEVTAGDPFNVLTGVKATGSNGTDYTNKIKIATPNATIAADGTLNTETVMNAVVKYSITLTDPEYYIEVLRTITIKAPERPAGEMIANPSFADGMLHWDTYTGAGAATFTPDGENGIKIEITAVGDKWEPRITQMGVPFENGKAYKISFEAKALEPKTVNLQVGELLSGAPYFVNFKTALVTRVIGTEWATYEYEFMMNQPQENHRGGVLFEFGTIDGDDTCTTVWLRKVKAEVVTLSPDKEPPVIKVRDLELPLGAEVTLDMLIESITDERDGVIPIDLDHVQAVVKQNGEVVEVINNEVEGTYTIEFKVKDKAGNEATAVATLTFKAMTFLAENLVKNGEFKENIENWGTWFANGDGTAVTFEHDATNQLFKTNVTATGEQDWSVQVYQTEIPIVAGKTYKLSFKLKASVARTFGLEVVDGFDSQHPVPIMAKISPSAETTWKEYSYIFTCHQTPKLGKLVFMFGKGEPAVWELDDVKIVQADLPEYLVNSQLDSSYGWRFFTNSWDGTIGNMYVMDGEFILVIKKRANAGAGNWTLQLIQDKVAYTRNPADDNQPLFALEAGKTYIFKFDVQGDEVFNITPLITQGEAKGWVNLLPEASRTIEVTAEKVTHSIEFTVPADYEGLAMAKFEFGSSIPNFDLNPDTADDPLAGRVIKFSNLSVKEKDNDKAKELLYNGDGKATHGFVFENAGGGDLGSMKMTVEQNLEVTTTGLGGEAYIPHVYQGDISLDAGDYVVKLVVKASVARTLRVNLTVPSQGYRSLLPDNKYDIVITNEQVGEYVTVMIRFSVDAPTSGVKFEIDFGPIAEGDAAGVFLFKEILLYREFN
jgi:hypothetical protein